MSADPTEPQAVEPEVEVVPEGAVEEAPSPEPEPDPVALAEARAQEYLDLAQRKQAEFENYRKRMSAQAAVAEDRGVGRVARELLPALDHLELALAAAELHAPPPPPPGAAGTGESAEWVKGIRAVQDEFKTALGRVGIEAFVPLGEAFDPTQHEAMAQAPFEGCEPGTVAEVYQAGYRLGPSILRPARVVVAE